MKIQELKMAVFRAVLPAMALPLILFSGCKDEPQPVAPTVTTVSAVTEITATTAAAGGEVTMDGEAEVTSRGVCWGISPEPTTAGSKTVNDRGTGAFKCMLTGLAPSTTYHIRAYAVNSAGTGYGDEVTFTTLSGEVSVTTAAADLVTPFSARSGGKVTEDGGAEIAERGVCWGTATAPTADGNKATAGTGGGEFTAKLTGLAPSTAYYVRAYAINSAGTLYGNEITFTTLSGEKGVTTTEANNIAATSARSGGNVADDGGAAVIAKGVCWGTASNPTIEGDNTTNGSGTGGFESRITGLTPATKYYLRAYATNAVGTEYGNEVTFTTLSGKAGITTAEADNITTTSARSGGEVTDDGGSPVTAKGVCWSTSRNPAIEDAKSVNCPGTGDFLNDLTGLTPGTTYYVRAYATNELGDTHYGNEVSFDTVDLLKDLAPGTLQAVVESLGLEDAGSLTLGGTIDQRDFAYMKSLVDKRNLQDIDLSDVTVAAYGNYPANGIPASAFYFSSGLASFVFPAGITSIGDNAFYYCWGCAGSLEIPGSVTSIGKYAFSNCSGFTGSLVIPDGVISIEECAFEYCSGFTGSLAIPGNVTSIGDEAFYYCTGFTGLTIGGGVKKIGKSAFYYCTGFTGSLVIPGNVASVGTYAFYGCTGFDGSLTIGNGVASIGNYAFSGCTGFGGSLTIGDGAVSIGDYAFSGCTGFTGSLLIPESVEKIGAAAFNRCNALSDIKVEWTIPITYKGNMLPFGKTVYVPAASAPLYEAADGWQNHRIIGY